MKRLTFAVLGFFFGVSVLAMAANTATQTVTFEVQAINEISVSGNPGALTVSVATAGSEPTDATNSTTTYNITSNGTGKKITGAINTAMPSGTSLKVSLAAPTGATSAGTVTLSITAANLVTGITQKAESSKTITYTLSATVSAGVVASASKTVTLTLTDGP
ncbi:hypothetical protein HYR99_01495 [Candidatus Poribacteria bacterium]|nr:hypothetical protein [Candidatus Poribacteria bacterium]